MKLMLNVRFNNEFHVCVSHSCEAHVSEYFYYSIIGWLWEWDFEKKPPACELIL